MLFSIKYSTCKESSKGCRIKLLKAAVDECVVGPVRGVELPYSGILPTIKLLLADSLRRIATVSDPGCPTVALWQYCFKI